MVMILGRGKLDETTWFLFLRLFQVGFLKNVQHVRYIYIRYMLFSCFFSESNVYVLKPARCFSLNSFSYKGSYFKFRGEGSQIFWICFGGAAGQGAV